MSGGESTRLLDAVSRDLSDVRMLTSLVALLALTFLWSGASKLKHPGSAALAAQRFGLVHAARSGLGIAMGVAECALGAVLSVATFWQPLVAPAALVGFAVLFGFSVLIARALQKGESFSCACFGDFGDDAISGWHLIRNTLLGAACLVSGIDALAGPAGNLAHQAKVYCWVVAASAIGLLITISICLRLRTHEDPFVFYSEAGVAT